MLGPEPRSSAKFCAEMSGDGWLYIFAKKHFSQTPENLASMRAQYWPIPCHGGHNNLPQPFNYERPKDA